LIILDDIEITFISLFNVTATHIEVTPRRTTNNRAISTDVWTNPM